MTLKHSTATASAIFLPSLLSSAAIFTRFVVSTERDSPSRALQTGLPSVATWLSSAPSSHICCQEPPEVVPTEFTGCRSLRPFYDLFQPMCTFSAISCLQQHNSATCDIEMKVPLYFRQKISTMLVKFAPGSIDTTRLLAYAASSSMHAGR